MGKFQEINSKQNFPELEEEIISFWKENNIFEKSIENRDPENPYRFYDGPPFITGMPHYGHLLASSIKDAVPRYWTMKGKRCERVWGWDCHGIAVEEKVMKKLGIGSNSEIETFGIEKFINECYVYTNEVSSEWNWYIDHIGRWVDMDNAYKTMDQNYMESVMRTFKQFYDKGLVYKGKRISLYSVKLGTPISNFEVAMDDSYESVNDPAITVKFDLTINGSNWDGVSALVWTTTPWTLPSNLALAVNKKHSYVIVKSNDGKFVLAKNRLQDVFKGKGDYEILDEFLGEKLVGLSYEPLFQYYVGKVNENNFKIYDADFITDTDGTGIGHQAPEFGEVDFQLGKDNGLHQTESIDDECKYSNEISDYKGRYIKDVQEDIMLNLKERNILFKKENITHRVAVCPRTGIPLVYRTQDSWFLDIQGLKEKLLEQNKNINWFPEHLKNGRFGKNIEAAPDWCLSRKRYWATPMPMWICNSCGNLHVIGSKEELENLSGKKVSDLHRPFIDEINWNCDNCSKGTYQRVPEVLDVWLESGSMSLSQFHYPFNNKENFEKAYPADFIVEYVGQIRAWFYVMHVVGVALFGKNAYNNVITTGIIAGNDGRKMSKSFGNFTDPKELLQKYGGDAIRFYMLSSPLVKGGDMSFLDEGVLDTVKKILLPIWNTLSFFITYANIDNYDGSEILINGNLNSGYFNDGNLNNILDKWVISELNQLIKNVDNSMENYDLQSSTRYIFEFIDNLTNWYIRRSRRRFWKAENDLDKIQAYNTLYFVLIQFSKVLAPICPFISEKMFKILTGKSSVHLEDFPIYNEKLINSVLNDEMMKVQNLITLGLSLRSKNGLRVRQPLSTITIGESLNKYYIDILKEELNIKEVISSYDMGLIAKKIAMPNAKLLGPKYGKSVQVIIKEAKLGNFTEIGDGKISILDFVLEENEYDIAYDTQGSNLSIEGGYGTVLAMDINVTDDLYMEGIARDIVRFIQEARKEVNYNVSDRIKLKIISDNEKISSILSSYLEYIQSETLSTYVENLEKNDISKSFEIDGIKLEINLYNG